VPVRSRLPRPTSSTKCADSIPLYRQAKALHRVGIPVARTTMGDLFHTSAEVLQPLVERILQLVRESHLVLADETPMRVQAEGKTRRGYLWTFRITNLIAYRFSPTRSGDTPAEVLEGTCGYLLVDGYTGYNVVVVPNGRVRVGCWAHTRRRFFDALPTAPEAQGMLDLILALYRVEHEVTDAKLLGTTEHLQRRRAVSAPLLEQIRDWLQQHSTLHPPKSPLGEAIRYIRGQWEALGRFLEDASLPLGSVGCWRGGLVDELLPHRWTRWLSDTAGDLRDRSDTPMSTSLGGLSSPRTCSTAEVILRLPQSPPTLTRHSGCHLRRGRRNPEWTQPRTGKPLPARSRMLGQHARRLQRSSVGLKVARTGASGRLGPGDHRCRCFAR
jgi:hypothetical protein